MLATKLCKKCGVEQNVDQFTKGKNWSDGFYPWCLTCKAKYQKARKQSLSKEERARLGAEWRQKVNSNAEAREKYLQIGVLYAVRHRYGLDADGVIALSKAQGGVCAICGSPPKEGKRGRLHVDHDHKTNDVRGLLCDSCNTGIGKLRDNPAILQKAIEYLANPPARGVVTKVKPRVYRKGPVQ